MLNYLLLFNKRLEFDLFFNFIQNSHVHEPSKLVENLHHLYITTAKNLTSNHCLDLKSLGFSVLKYVVLTSRWHSIVFSQDVTAAILVSQNNETAAILVSQTSPVGVELFSYANALFCSNKFA